MPECKVKYQTDDAAVRYQDKIESKRKLSAWLELHMVRRSLAQIRGQKILDCPCGTGRIDPVLREKFSDIFGVDNAQPMLDVYLARNTERKGQLGSIFELPFADNEFDWTVSHRLLHHFNSDEERIGLLRSISRVSRNGFTFYCWLDKPFGKRGSKSKDGRQSISRAKLDEIVKSVSCTIEKVYYASWPISPKVMVVCRK